MLASDPLILLLKPPYAWVLTGLVIGFGLLWTGLVQRPSRVAEHRDESS